MKMKIAGVDILNNISSNNTIVNSATGVVLSSNVALEDFENIIIANRMQRLCCKV